MIIQGVPEKITHFHKLKCLAFRLMKTCICSARNSNLWKQGVFSGIPCSYNHVSVKIFSKVKLNWIWWKLLGYTIRVSSTKFIQFAVLQYYKHLIGKIQYLPLTFSFLKKISHLVSTKFYKQLDTIIFWCVPTEILSVNVNELPL